MTSERIEEIFKNIGKVIRLGEIGAADASGIKTHMVHTVKQFADNAGADDLYDDLASYITPFNQRVAPVVAALERLEGIGTTTVQSYLRVIAPELDEPANAPAATVLSSLAARMTANSMTIAPSGAFWNYFHQRFAFASFPSAPSPTIPDNWITTTII